MLVFEFLHSLLVLVGVVCVWRCVWTLLDGEREGGRGQWVVGLIIFVPTELVYKERRVVSALVGGGFGKERGRRV